MPSSSGFVSAATGVGFGNENRNSNANEDTIAESPVISDIMCENIFLQPFIAAKTNVIIPSLNLPNSHSISGGERKSFEIVVDMDT